MIHSKGVIVEMDGDQMTRVIWRLVKDKLILPFVDVKLEYYDLGLENRDRTDDRVTHDAAAAIRRQGVGVKCATITPSIAQVKEFGLKKAWPSPNGTIRGELDGTVFRKPILASNVPVAVRSWRKPIVIGRHAYGDIYKATEIEVHGPGRAEIVFTPIRQAQGESASGEPTRHLVHEFKGPGVVMAMHNTEKSVRSFARACLRYALDEKINIWFSSKDTISKTYHTFFKHVFAEEVAQRKDEMAAAGIAYRYLLIDDAVAQMMKHEGGILWALMNYDGDVQSDMVAAGFGSLGMMTSELVSPEGQYEFEAAHGTVARHYADHLAGKPTSTNSVATIFAWSGALRKRGELDKTPELSAFAAALERAVLTAIESGVMTRDLARLVHETADPPRESWVTTEEFISAAAQRLV
ncbi:MAG: NADP-dependent isocitrate dehydrogenase [Candidatus Brocadiia bacterium]